MARATLAEFESGKRTPIANNLDAMIRALKGAGITFLPNDGVALHRVYWRRTQDGDVPPPSTQVIIAYTIDRHGTQPAIFDVEAREWHLPNMGMTLEEKDVSQWAPGPWDYPAKTWAELDPSD